MTEKQERFVEEVIATHGNATEAAARVFNCKDRKTAASMGNEYLRKPEIAQAIEERQTEVMEKVQQRTEISREWVLNRLVEVTDRCMQKVPVMRYDKEKKDYEQVVDTETGEGMWTFNANGACKSLELIGKEIGMYESIQKNINLDITSMSPDERKRRIDELNAKRGAGTAGAP